MFDLVADELVAAFDAGDRGRFVAALRELKKLVDSD
jgi:hypothetical protein